MIFKCCLSLDRLGEAFKLLSTNLISEFFPSDSISEKSLLDSMPIITCSGKREGKVAREITDKGFCSTKGLMVHVFGRLAAAYIYFIFNS